MTIIKKVIFFIWVLNYSAELLYLVASGRAFPDWVLEKQKDFATSFTTFHWFTHLDESATTVNFMVCCHYYSDPSVTNNRHKTFYPFALISISNRSGTNLSLIIQNYTFFSDGYFTLFCCCCCCFFLGGGGLNCQFLWKKLDDYLLMTLR